METQLNSSETDVEDSKRLNTEEVFTENDRDVILAEDHNDPEDEKIQMVLKDELQKISQQLSGQCMIDEYVRDSSSPLKCPSRNCRNNGYKCKDCKIHIPFPIEKEKNKEPEPEKNQSPSKKKNGKPTKKHMHKKSVRDKQWRENMLCSSIDSKINRQRKGDS